LNIIGMGMLVPMPIFWLWDWTIIGLDLYRMITMAVSHSVFQMWETGVQTISFRRILGIRLHYSVLLAIAINVVYVLLAMTFIRKLFDEFVGLGPNPAAAVKMCQSFSLPLLFQPF
jgi:hypothetical protein